MDRPLQTTGRPWRAMTHWSSGATIGRTDAGTSSHASVQARPHRGAIGCGEASDRFQSSHSRRNGLGRPGASSIGRNKDCIFANSKALRRGRAGRRPIAPVIDRERCNAPTSPSVRCHDQRRNGSCDGNAIGGGRTRNVPHKCESGRRRLIGPRRSAVRRSHYPTLNVLALSDGEAVRTRRTRNTRRYRVR